MELAELNRIVRETRSTFVLPRRGLPDLLALEARARGYRTSSAAILLAFPTLVLSVSIVGLCACQRE